MFSPETLRHIATIIGIVSSIFIVMKFFLDRFFKRKDEIRATRKPIYENILSILHQFDSSIHLFYLKVKKEDVQGQFNNYKKEKTNIEGELNEYEEKLNLIIAGLEQQNEKLENEKELLEIRKKKRDTKSEKVSVGIDNEKEDKINSNRSIDRSAYSMNPELQNKLSMLDRNLLKLVKEFDEFSIEEFLLIEQSVIDLLKIHSVKLYGSNKVNKLINEYLTAAHNAIEIISRIVKFQDENNENLSKSYDKKSELLAIKSKLETQLRCELK